MYGAILGDIIGSPYEFDRGDKKKDFPLFIGRSRITDDSLMTIAVCEGVMNSRGKSDEDVKKAITASIKKWALNPKYNNVLHEYGGRFKNWLLDPASKPYNSMGNGSAMRVSSIGWLFDSLEETRRYARLSAEISHNHPDGIAGAEATASIIFMARKGYSKDEIRQYITNNFKYDLSRSVDEIRPNYHQLETCPDCLPEAITCFLESDSYEDCIRNCISIGGDTDTIGCIAGSMAEAFYGVPAHLKTDARKYLDNDMQKVLDRFNREKLKYTDNYKEMFVKDKTSPVDIIDKMNKVGDKTFQELREVLSEQNTDEDISEEGSEYCKFASRATSAGFSINDIEALWNAKKFINKKPENISPEAEKIRRTCLTVWDNVINNRRDGLYKHLTYEDRIENLEVMRDCLDKYADSLHDDKSELSLKITEVASAGLDARIKAGLEPDEKVQVADSVQELTDLLETVDPSMMPSSGKFKAFKAALKKLAEAERNLQENDTVSEHKYKVAAARATLAAHEYLDYKKNQNKGSHKRSEIELKRVKIVNTMLHRLESENLPMKKPEMEDAKSHELIWSAKKTLTLDKDRGLEDSEKLKAASVLYAAKNFKEKNQKPTAAALAASAEKYASNKSFKSAVFQTPKKEIDDAIRNGNFDRRFNIREAYAKQYPKIPVPYILVARPVKKKTNSAKAKNNNVKNNANANKDKAKNNSKSANSNNIVNNGANNTKSNNNPAARFKK